MKTTLEFTDEQLDTIARALRLQAQHNQRDAERWTADKHHALARIYTRRVEECDALAARFERCTESYDGPSCSRGDREDFHADG